MKRIECLDGLRGFAAMWVMFGHIAILTGFRIPLLSTPDYAVDLFMLLSGFLMVLHHGSEDWKIADTSGRFLIKRVFRIAPLYYVLLAVALLSAPMLGEMREVIVTTTGGDGTLDSRYTDQSLKNILLHVSFLFGALPEYAYRTPLPDWSIGLEMMFYAFFPVLMLIRNVTGLAILSLASTALCWAAALLLPGFFGDFEQPAILVLKLNVFLAGMLVAHSLQLAGVTRILHLLTGLIVAVTPISVPLSAQSLAIHAALFAFFALMVDFERFWGTRVTRPVSRALGSAFARLLGDISYGVYLLHLLIVIPIAAWVAPSVSGAPARFTIVSIVAAVVVCSVAYLLHIAIERPGIAAGRRVISKLFARRRVVTD